MASLAASDDPRYRRVCAQLTAALLDLASTRPAESIAVAELATAAGVSRAAFYDHATSPLALLARTLIAEIDPPLQAALDQLSVPKADYVDGWRRVYLDLLVHTGTYRPIYGVAMTQGSALCSLLTDHFERTTEPCIRAITSHFDGPVPSELWTRMAVTQQAHNMISFMRAYVSAELADPPETVVDVYMSLAPPWQLARSDGHGAISLRRTRTTAKPVIAAKQDG